MQETRTDSGIRPVVWVAIGLTVLLIVALALVKPRYYPPDQRSETEAWEASDPAPLSAESPADQQRSPRLPAFTAKSDPAATMAPERNPPTSAGPGSRKHGISGSPPKQWQDTPRQSMSHITADLDWFTRNAGSNSGWITSPPQKSAARVYRISARYQPELELDEERIESRKAVIERMEHDLEREFADLTQRKEEAINQAKAKAAELEARGREFRANMAELNRAAEQVRRERDVAFARANGNDRESITRYNNLVDKYRRINSELAGLEFELRNEIQNASTETDRSLQQIQDTYNAKVSELKTEAHSYSGQVDDLNVLIRNYNAKLQRYGTPVR